MAAKISFYFDEHMPRDVERRLIERGYQVIMAVDVGMMSKDDDTEHLPFAKEKSAVVVTRDKPLPDEQPSAVTTQDLSAGQAQTMILAA